MKKLFYLITAACLLFFCFLVLRKEPPVHDNYCAFCNPDVLQRQTFYEDDLVLALYTHKPMETGHCLILPKRHVKQFDELSTDESNQMMAMIKTVHSAVKSLYGNSSYMLVEKNGKEAFQTVPHVHFHYVPRKNGDVSGLKFLANLCFSEKKKPMDKESMKKMTEALRRAMLNTQNLTSECP